MRRSLLPLGLICIVLGLLAAACANKPGAAQEPVKLTESDNHNRVELAEGQVLEIVLPENPSTGYHWEVQSYDADVLEPLGSGTYTPSAGSEGSVGAGGEIELRFKALRPGETELVLGNFPPGEDKPEDTFFEVAVTVTSASQTSGQGEEGSGH